MRIATITLSALALVAVATAAHAGTAPATAPIFVNNGEAYGCTVANTGTKDIASVEVKLIIAGGAVGGTQTCAPLTAGGVCSAGTTAGSSANRWCTVTTIGSSKTLRGRFCNTGTGECENMR